MNKITIQLEDLLLCMSGAQDLLSPHLSSHHQRVAYLSFRLAEKINLPREEQRDIFYAALVHDIGALSFQERLEIIDGKLPGIHRHAFRGEKLLRGFRPLRKSADIIRYHHVPWEDGRGAQFHGESVSLASHVIHLADWVCLRIRDGTHILTQLSSILESVRGKSGSRFVPSLVDALLGLEGLEYCWLDLTSAEPTAKLRKEHTYHALELKIDDVVDLALVFSQIIDFRSGFTSRHSAGVAKTAERLAFLAGFSPYECKMMLVAGYLHDFGKIAISNEILEKPGKLDAEEIDEMRAHTYYTYHLLDTISQFQTINTWASYHHEKLNGKGYPFHIRGEDLSLGARIMAVADVFTAITENRPYREGMEEDPARKVLENMVKSNALDGRVVGLLLEHYDGIRTLLENAQSEAAERYRSFLREEEPAV